MKKVKQGMKNVKQGIKNVKEGIAYTLKQLLWLRLIIRYRGSILEKEICTPPPPPPPLCPPLEPRQATQNRFSREVKLYAFHIVSSRIPTSKYYSKIAEIKYFLDELFKLNLS